MKRGANTYRAARKQAARDSGTPWRTPGIGKYRPVQPRGRNYLTAFDRALLRMNRQIGESAK